ncbi:hypothetical protein GGH12_004715 [Coemansia sp. RSA 1822]|nr:hypothetical protein LPJ76_004662 [Coemansia sp. RSA 638]KAJ2560572.1 hypothetical protein GGH12_004715 [Coemansia sp. RSA 1822]KAJ2656479.1 hypothetical protein IW148_005599 [Coemansia sp. RSA 1199]
MLSNGINSRLQQLHRNNMSHITPECRPLGQQADYSQVSTRRGRAADLIHKFNQLATPKDGVKAATIGRATVGSRRDGLRQLFSSTSPGDTPPLLAAAAEDNTSTPRDYAQPLARRLETPGVSQDDSVLGQTRQSVFLSDSELDHALSEIREFSRNMNISLGEDDTPLCHE